MDIYEKLKPIFADTFDDDEIAVTPELTADDVPEWDSLSHIRLMVAIERAFGIKFAVSEITDLKNVGELVDVIKKRC